MNFCTLGPASPAGASATAPPAEAGAALAEPERAPLPPSAAMPPTEPGEPGEPTLPGFINCISTCNIDDSSCVCPVEACTRAAGPGGTTPRRSREAVEDSGKPRPEKPPGPICDSGEKVK